jgi:hypothetical protein
MSGKQMLNAQRVGGKLRPVPGVRVTKPVDQSGQSFTMRP